MQRVLISYDLLEPNHTEADRKALYVELELLGAVQVQDSVWIAQTEMSVAYISTKLRSHFGKTDRLLVALLSDDIRVYKGLNAV